MEKHVTVLTNVRVSNLGIPVSYLEENGIECFLKDEVFGEMHPGISVKLQVGEEDAEKAIELLMEGGFLEKEDFEEYSDPLTRFADKLFGRKKEDE